MKKLTSVMCLLVFVSAATALAGGYRGGHGGGGYHGYGGYSYWGGGHHGHGSSWAFGITADLTPLIGAIFGGPEVVYQPVYAAPPRVYVSPPVVVQQRVYVAAPPPQQPRQVWLDGYWQAQTSQVWVASGWAEVEETSPGYRLPDGTWVDAPTTIKRKVPTGGHWEQQPQRVWVPGHWELAP